MTTLTEQRFERSEQLAKDMSSHGVQTTPYKRGPFQSGSIFGMGRDRDGTIRIWQGDSEAEIVAHSDVQRQVVLRMYENSRSIKTNIKLSNFGKGIEKARWDEFDTNQQRQRIRSSIRLSIPGLRIRSWEPTTIKKNTIGWKQDGPEVDHVNTFNVAGYAPKHESHFLIGYDEKTTFICELPKAVTSIRNAHQSLRPDDLRRGFKRQGEWFFEPATPEELTAIEEHFSNPRRTMAVSGIYSSGKRPNSWIRNNENHKSICIAVDKQTYAIGPVRDNRQDHHSVLMLANWHRVRRNQEVLNNADTARTTTWD